MSDFSFVGKLPASKSLMNRALIVQSFYPYFKVNGDNHCDDVRALMRGLDQMHRNVEIDCGSGGTTLRFLALRASRIPGEHILTGTPRLFSRPQDELLKILRQLSVEAVIDNNQLRLKSKGWHPMGDGLHIPTERSSQFASAVLLSAWSLNFPLALALGHRPVSQSYLNMTKRFLRRLGMAIEEFDSDLRLAPAQELHVEEANIESDVSTAFAVAAAAAVSGTARIKSFPEVSLQPDHYFVKILERMNVPVKVEEGTLFVERAHELKGIEVDIGQCPDLAPVLGALCALALGPSRVYGAHQLKHKESHRIEKTVELIKLLGREATAQDDGFIIVDGAPSSIPLNFDFNPDEDHRMAFAAGVAMKAGHSVALSAPEVVTKSFPEFWQVLGL